MVRWQMLVGNGFFRSEWASSSEQMIETKLNPMLTDTQDLINLSIGYETEHWTLLLWAKNVTDHTSKMLAAELPLFADSYQYWLNAPRSVGGTIRVDY